MEFGLTVNGLINDAYVSKQGVLFCVVLLGPTWFLSGHVSLFQLSKDVHLKDRGSPLLSKKSNSE